MMTIETVEVTVSRLENNTKSAQVTIHDEDEPRIGYWSKDGAIDDHALNVIRDAGWEVNWIASRTGSNVGSPIERVAYVEIVEADR